MIRRVEVIPAQAMVFVILYNVGASTYQFMGKKFFDDFNDDDKDDGKYALAIEALKCFSDKYEPATQETSTDLFTSKEIQRLVDDHLGYHFSISDLSATLTNMGYTYKLEENNFIWMCKKV